MPTKSRLDAEIAVFREAMEGVRPLKPSQANSEVINSKRIAPQRVNLNTSSNRASPPPIKARYDLYAQTPIHADVWHADIIEHTDEISEYIGANVERGVLRQLYRGYWPIVDEIDLHGLRSNEALHALQRFFQATQGKRCLLIVHGKGYGSDHQLPVLAIRLKRWLKAHPLVLAFRHAPLNKGGSGALLVLVKS